MLPDKSVVLALIIDQLTADLNMLEAAVALSRETATHKDCLGSSKYETMGLEASYLAQGQGTRLLEIERALELFKRVSMSESESVEMNSLVRLEDESGHCQLLWLAMEAGGLKVSVDEDEVTIVTPKSPLGRALMGKQVGEQFDLLLNSKVRTFEVLCLS